jgi:peptide/nickel transport system substrate-binding protein
MKRLLLTVVLGTCAALSAHAQVMRWASQGDAQTMDPVSQNEGLTNSINQMVYERLVRRDKQLGLVPSLATEWQQTSPLTWRFKLRPNVKFR